MHNVVTGLYFGRSESLARQNRANGKIDQDDELEATGRYALLCKLQ